MIVRKGKVEIGNSGLWEETMKRSWFYGLAAAILLSLATAPVLAASVEGELVDSRCYLNMGAKRSDHQMCAQACAKSGLPLGVLTGKGKYYTLVVQPQPLAEYAGEQVRVEGKLDKKSSTITPEKLEVSKDGSWQAVELPKQMM